MAIMFSSVLVGLCLGIVCSDHIFSKSKSVHTALRDSLVNFDSTKTYLDADDDGFDSSFDMDQVSQVDLHSAMINEIVRHMSQGLAMDDDSNCWCKDYTCGCCYQINIPLIKFQKSACLSLTYLPAASGVQVIYSVEGKVIIDQTITESNPQPVCTFVPFHFKLASICLRFTNLEFSSQSFTGCAALETKFMKLVVRKIDLGCFKIPPKAETEMYL